MSGLNTNLTRLSTLFSGALCALCLGLCTLTAEAQSTGPEPAYQEGQTGGLISVLEPKKTAIVGTWIGTLSNGLKFVATYNSDGTAHFSRQAEVKANPGVVTPLHGVWTYLGSRQFGATFIGILYDLNTGQLTGFVKVRFLMTLNEAGDEISDIDGPQLLDPQGNVIVSFPVGNGSSKRIQVEPFN